MFAYLHSHTHPEFITKHDNIVNYVHFPNIKYGVLMHAMSYKGKQRLALASLVFYLTASDLRLMYRQMALYWAVIALIS